MAKRKPRIGSEIAMERDWQAQEDARVLAQASEIQSDPTRIKNAADVAKKMADEKAKQVSNLRKVARKAPRKGARRG